MITHNSYMKVQEYILLYPCGTSNIYCTLRNYIPDILISRMSKNMMMNPNVFYFTWNFCIYH